MKKALLIILTLVFFESKSQNYYNDSLAIRLFFETEFTQGKAYNWLQHLCLSIGGRLSGSKQAEMAVNYTFEELNKQGFDSVWLQPVMVPHWVRGAKEVGKIVLGKKNIPVNICALGNSVATPKEGLTAEIIEVKTFDELRALGSNRIKGKIVFFNRPFPVNVLTGGAAYGASVDQRGRGPIEAAKMGAVGVVVRSMTHAYDHFPHTGATNYLDSVVKIPGCAISTVDADMLSNLIAANPNLKFYFKQDCKYLGEVLSYNVIAQINGNVYPNEIILVGGHLDSWDNGQGAHDDGSGSVQSMEALRLFAVNGIRPKRTLRCVLFMNEENGLKGGLEYARVAAMNNEKHLAAIETDAGGFMPREIGISVSADTLNKLQPWQKLLAPYGIQTINQFGGGADIGPLKKQGTVLIGYHPDGQKYFDYHHTANDTFDKVNKRELQFGVVSIAGLMYLLSEYGF